MRPSLRAVTPSGTRLRRSALSLLPTLLAAGLIAVMSPRAASQEATREAPSKAMSVPYSSAEWHTIVPELGQDSPQIAILHVDPKTQATQLLIRVPKGLHVPMHWHSANETHTVIQGDWVFEHEGKLDRLAPGGFNYIPARMRHQAWASDNALVFITVDARWDINWVTGPPGKSELGKLPPPETTP